MSDGDHLAIRHEQAGDEDAIRRLNDAAFGGSEESRIIDAARDAGRAVISLVAVQGSRIIGSILFTRVTIESPGGGLALGLGPMAVAPDVQRRGIGSRLVTAGLAECRRLGYRIVVVLGHPTYYPRFGFRRASRYGLRSEYDAPDGAFMVVELTPGALTGVAGLVRFGPEFAPT